jgi:uncharacterized protein YggT (Ycf19 family)
MSNPARSQVSTGSRIARGLVVFVYGFAIACTVILAMAFFLELFNANESTPFVDWVDRAATRIMQPFRGIFPPVEGESGSVFDSALLFGIFMYWLLAIAMQALVGWIDRRIAARRAEEMWPGRPTSPAHAAGSSGAAQPVSGSRGSMPAPPPTSSQT